MRAKAQFLWCDNVQSFASQTNGTVNHANIITGFTHQPIHRPTTIFSTLIVTAPSGCTVSRWREKRYLPVRIHELTTARTSRDASDIPLPRILRKIEWIRRERTNRCTERLASSRERLGTWDIRTTRCQLHCYVSVTSRLSGAPTADRRLFAFKYEFNYYIENVGCVLFKRRSRQWSTKVVLSLLYSLNAEIYRETFVWVLSSKRQKWYSVTWYKFIVYQR